MYAMLARQRPAKPAIAPFGCYGICPVCECGGNERPCWYCGHSESFTANDRHLIQVD